MSETNEEAERGVKNPKVVDLIMYDTARDAVVLTMIEDRPWGSSEEQLDQLESKFNNYIDYILDGWLVSQYPQYEGKRFCIRVEGVHIPDENQSRFFRAMERFCSEQQIGFEVGTLGSGSDAH